MPDPFDIRSGVDPGRVLANFGTDGSLTLIGPIIAADQAIDPTQVPGSTVIYTKNGQLYTKGTNGVATQVGSGGASAVFPLSGYGLVAASMDPSQGMNTSNIASGQAFFARTYVPANTAITSLWCAVRDAGTWDGATAGSTIGIYTDAGVFVDQIGVNNALWASNGWVGGALTGGPIPGQSTARYVYLAGLVRGMTVAPGTEFLASANDGAGNLAWFNAGVPGSGLTNRRAFYLGALTALPGSFAPASAGTATTFVLMLGAS